MLTPMRWLRKMRGMAKSYIIRRRRIYAAAAQHGLCYWCDTPLDLTETTADHVVPRSRGGSTLRQSNIVAACFSCNHHRSNREGPPSDAYLRQRRIGYLRGQGVEGNQRWGGWRKSQENFGRGPDGERLWAPQYGIM